MYNDEYRACARAWRVARAAHHCDEKYAACVCSRVSSAWCKGSKGVDAVVPLNEPVEPVPGGVLRPPAQLYRDLGPFGAKLSNVAKDDVVLLRRPRRAKLRGRLAAAGAAATLWRPTAGVAAGALPMLR